MSPSLPEREDGGGGGTEDQLDLAAAGNDGGSSDDETVEAGAAEDHIAEILEEERQEAAGDTEEDPYTNGAAHNRYRQLLRDQEETSESGSTDGLPRRAGSPVDSLLSAAYGPPSVQVKLACLLETIHLG